MRIIRYSVNGFKPQKQTYHIKQFEDTKQISILGFPEWSRFDISKIIKKKLEFYEEHKSDLQEGVWFFLDGHKNNMSLNHLKKKVPCWEAEIDDDAQVYSFNLDEVIRLDNDIVKFGGCYIPTREMSKIKNIKRRK